MAMNNNDQKTVRCRDTVQRGVSGSSVVWQVGRRCLNKISGSRRYNGVTYVDMLAKEQW